MDEDKILYLYTAGYPYGKAESFLENEIPVLSKKFAHIHIHPLLSSQEPIRSLPGNVTVNEPVNDRKGINTSAIFFKNIALIFNILSVEYRNCGNKFFFLKNIRHFNSLAIRAVHDSHLIISSLKHDPKNIIFYSYWMNDWALALAILKQKSRIGSFVFRCGGFDIYDERHPGTYLPFRYFIYKQTTAIYPNSKDGMNYIKRKNYFPEKVHVHYWGTNDYGLNPFDPEKELTIVSCSNVIPLKRVHLIVEILKVVKINVNWVHFGDGVCLEDLKRSVEKLPSNINCLFKGRVPNTEVVEFYKQNSVSLFITTSETESLPVSIQEAISFGIPIIATNVGGISEIVTEQTGFLIEKEFDVKDVAEIINKFDSDIRNTIKFRKGIREVWMKNFGAEKNYSYFAQQLIKG